MSVPHPGGDPNANLLAQLKRDVLERVPQVMEIQYLPDAIEARRLRATFDPDRLEPGPEALELGWDGRMPHETRPRRRCRTRYSSWAGWEMLVSGAVETR